MADYDSDSSAGDDIETNVLLGYASKEPTVDDFSQLGGHPIWLDLKTAPDGALAKCKVCNGLMNLLLQLNGDLPDRFAGHERRLYVWACRRKACRRKDGSVRGFRATRQTAVKSRPVANPIEKEDKPAAQPPTNLGETLFGVKPNPGSQANPFAAPGSSSSAQANPFATASSLAAKLPQKPAEPAPTEALPQTFAEKARLASPPPTEPTQPSTPPTPWPEKSSFPEPYPPYYIDADKEYIDATPDALPQNVRVDNGEGSSSNSGEKDMKDAFESSMDKTFQKFADRLSQNPEQVLRYEFDGQPLLYSKKDKVGKLLDPPQGKDAKVKTSGSGRIPRCTNCGAERVFELQLTPHGITELEAEDMSLDGMDWGTILLGVCSKDCQEKGKKEGEVGYVEEWVGVQWEELGTKK
ncbi:putative programmed cell death protein [Septoria linicola]|nr:putative programmed cell death protein [Septoria linicola]